MQLGKPEIEFVKLEFKNTIATSAGYIVCENAGASSLGSLANFCSNYGNSMSNATYDCVMSSASAGDYVYNPPTP